MNPGRRTVKTPTRSVAPAAAFSRPRARVPGARGPAGPSPDPAWPPWGRPHRENQLSRCARVSQLGAAPLCPAGSPRLLGVASGPHGVPDPYNFSPTLPPAGKWPLDVIVARRLPARKHDTARCAVTMGTKPPRLSRVPDTWRLCVSGWLELPPGRGGVAGVVVDRGRSVKDRSPAGEVRGRGTGAGFQGLGLGC